PSPPRFRSRFDVASWLSSSARSASSRCRACLRLISMAPPPTTPSTIKRTSHSMPISLPGYPRHRIAGSLKSIKKVPRRPDRDRTSGLSSSVHVSAPGAGLVLPALDELLEPLRVQLHLGVVHADRRADLLGHRVRLPVDLHHDLATVIIQPVERHHPGLPRAAADAVPGDPLVRVLLGDLGVELTPGPGDLGHPVVVRLV